MVVDCNKEDPTNASPNSDVFKNTLKFMNCKLEAIQDLKTIATALDELDD